MAVKRAKKSSRSAANSPAKAKSSKSKASVAKRTRVATTQVKKTARKPQSKPQSKTTAAAKNAGIKDVVKVVEGALDDMKAVNVKVMDVHKLTDITDTMVIASGNSDRHGRRRRA